jgi:hypothetical protein
MQNPFIYELVGYAASVLVAVSVMNTNVLRLRIFNILGSAFFTVYGLLIASYPIAAVNLFIVCVNAFHLYRMVRAKEYFRTLEVQPDSTYLRHFLSHYLKDIKHDHPDFAYEPSANQITLFVLRDTVPAGLFIGDVQPNGDLIVKLDYVTPDYRDMKVARFLLNQNDYLRAHGVTRIVSPAGSGRHAKYLKRMGFTPASSATDRAVLFTRSVA